MTDDFTIDHCDEREHRRTCIAKRIDESCLLALLERGPVHAADSVDVAGAFFANLNHARAPR